MTGSCLKASQMVCPSNPVVLKLGSPDVLGLQLPEILASTASGEGFWELQSKNIWGAQLENHWCKGDQRQPSLLLLSCLEEI